MCFMYCNNLCWLPILYTNTHTTQLFTCTSIYLCYLLCRVLFIIYVSGVLAQYPIQLTVHARLVATPLIRLLLWIVKMAMTGTKAVWQKKTIFLTDTKSLQGKLCCDHQSKYKVLPFFIFIFSFIKSLSN